MLFMVFDLLADVLQRFVHHRLADRECRIATLPGEMMIVAV